MDMGKEIKVFAIVGFCVAAVGFLLLDDLSQHLSWSLPRTLLWATEIPTVVSACLSLLVLYFGGEDYGKVKYVLVLMGICTGFAALQSAGIFFAYPDLPQSSTIYKKNSLMLVLQIDGWHVVSTKDSRGDAPWYYRTTVLETEQYCDYVIPIPSSKKSWRIKITFHAVEFEDSLLVEEALSNKLLEPNNPKPFKSRPFFEEAHIAEILGTDVGFLEQRAFEKLSGELIKVCPEIRRIDITLI